MQESVSTNDTPKRKTRRSYTKAFKSRIVAQCNNGEKSIAQLSLDHQINANLIHKWCRQFNASNKPQRMIPVMLDTTNPGCADVGSRIEVVYGAVTIRFYGSVDQRCAQVVLSALR